ncbi:hypothetical protein [Lactobacillus intestinalis]|uniref:hypothetical protein n=1 Tax=Lactobacillus intestinalis TaxID=151781 RepID=UPI0025A60191|nr:hypothetical protein [Lactobacillus intestinalis]
MKDDPHPRSLKIKKAETVLQYPNLDRVSNLTYIAEDLLEFYAHNLDMTYVLNDVTLNRLSEAHDVILA